MADGPRCKRRKQANPRRNNVTNYSNVVEANSDSDDEDKLHIVEEDSLPDDAGEDDALGLNGPVDHQDRWNGMGEDTLGPEAEPRDVRFPVKEECMSEGEEDCSTDAMVEEMLQQGDTAVIYPEAPEDEPRQGTPDASVHDENAGTPDAFSQLLTCPYCARGYKRYASLKEHIKYRHEKSEDNFSCSLCSYTFAHRTQLDRHMTVHKSAREQRHVTPTGGNRKFKCTECGKAFKYKHHLKEHLRIHSGEKPYECSNCKKRFSHSGSYSSHISSKKCIGLISVNGRPRPASKASQCTSPALPASPSVPPSGRTQLREKVENGRPLQEQLPVNQIKTEPVDYEYKPVVVASGVNGVFNGGPPLQAATSAPQGVVQAVVLPTVGLVSPISINLNDIQNVLKVAVDSNVIRQMLGSAHTNVAPKEPGAAGQTQPAAPSVISAISLPIVDQDGTTKIIINYNLDPSQAQLAAQSLKKEAVVSNGSICKAEKLPEDLTIKVEKGQQAKAEESASTCLLCEDCPSGLDALHDLKHCKAKGLKINGLEESKSDPAVSSLLSDGNLTPGQPPLKNLLSLLKAYYALNAEPTKEELTKISDSVSLPLDVVKKWFEKMHTGQIPVGSSSPPPGQEAPRTEPDGASPTPPPGQGGTATAEIATTRSEPSGQPSEPVASSSPLNLSAGGLATVRSEQDTEEPLDLSLPKLPRDEADGQAHQNSVYSVQEEPLNLTCTKRDPQQSDTTDGSPAPLYVPTPSANPINIVTAQLPTLVAIADQGSVSCLRALTTNNKTILIPQLTYTYSTSGNSPVGTETQQKTAQIGSNQEDTSSEGVSTVEDQNDSDSTPPRKRMRKTENGMYACDLCEKIFQKSSSLLRHKYEHTGKRPHECGICSKAFKHKHHLIEHMRLHSGEKPYQCDKCGKRFSHSGSYSQHMNHRYSYCKKEAQERGDGGSDPGPLEVMALPGGQLSDGPAASPPSHLDSDDRESSTREDDEESEEEEEEDELGDVGVNEDEIRVVRIGDDDEQGDSGGGEEEGGEEEEEEEMELAAEGDEVAQRNMEGEEAIAKDDGGEVQGSEMGDPLEEEEEEIAKNPDPVETEVAAACKGTKETAEESEGQNENAPENDHKVQNSDQVSEDREKMADNDTNVK
ncbi:zinc finger E-box-binding homeobox 1-like [Scleropages formosus]|uniref:zinc finger E-box-binding homeobox 1-like n=1 Tax=Scleropages formosus TaxID=113540 RepID=UPI0010FAA5D5|nr:zinc finger E-box-binding homeobox 1 [Scleropages formosus]